MEKPAQVTREAIVNAISVPFRGYLLREEKERATSGGREEEKRKRRGGRVDGQRWRGRTPPAAASRGAASQRIERARAGERRGHCRGHLR